MVKIYDKRNYYQFYGLCNQGIPFRLLHCSLGVRHCCNLEMVHQSLKENPALALPKMQMVHAQDRKHKRIRVKAEAAGNHLCRLFEKEAL